MLLLRFGGVRGAVQVLERYRLRRRLIAGMASMAVLVGHGKRATGTSGSMRTNSSSRRKRSGG